MSSFFLFFAGASSKSQGIFISLSLLAGIGLGGLMLIIGIFELIVVIIAGVKANNGDYYRYPLTIRFFN